VDTLNGTLALPQQTFEAIRSSVQSAHIVAQSIPDPVVAQTIIHTANKAFMSGMVDAIIVAGAIMVVASLVTLAILPAKIRPPQDNVLPTQPREALEASGTDPEF
jgi:hypothetical protein